MSDISPVQAELRDFANRVITFRELGQKTLRVLGNRAETRVMKIMVEGANEIRNDIILGMRNTPKTGKIYGKGYKNPKGKPVMHRASSPGWPPAVDTGDLLRSIIVDARWAEVEVGSIITNPAYPKFLEEGTRNMDARPWLWPAKTRNIPRIKAAMTRALREIADEMTDSRY